MYGRLLPAVLLAAAIVCIGGHRAGAQMFRVNPGAGQAPGGIGGLGAAGSSGLGSGLNSGLGVGSGLNVDLTPSLETSLPIPTATPIVTLPGYDDAVTSPADYDGPSDRSTSHSPPSSHAHHPSADESQDGQVASSVSHPVVSANGDPPDPPEDGDDGGGGGDEEDDDEEEETEDEPGRFPWLWVVLGVVALIVVFRR